MQNKIDIVEWGINIVGLSFGLADVYNIINIVLICITGISMIIKFIVYIIGIVKGKSAEQIKNDIEIIDKVEDNISDKIDGVQDLISKKEEEDKE